MTPLPPILSLTRRLRTIENPDELIALGFRSSHISSSRDETMYYVDVIDSFGERQTIVYADTGVPKKDRGTKVLIHADCESIRRYRNGGLLEMEVTDPIDGREISTAPTQRSNGAPNILLTERVVVYSGTCPTY